jgi:hypothetical protein
MSERSKKIWAVGLSTLSLAALFEAGRMTAAPLAEPQPDIFALPMDPDVPTDVVLLRSVFGMQQFKPGHVMPLAQPPKEAPLQCPEQDYIEPFIPPIIPAVPPRPQQMLVSGTTYRM